MLRREPREHIFLKTAKHTFQLDMRETVHIETDYNTLGSLRDDVMFVNTVWCRRILQQQQGTAYMCLVQ